MRDFVRMAAKAAGLTLVFSGSGEQEIGIDAETGRTLVRVSQKFYRPAADDIGPGEMNQAGLSLSNRAEESRPRIWGVQARASWSMRS